MDRRKVPRSPKPPRIQSLLRQALELKARLLADPNLTRDALASEVQIDPSQLTRRLRLADLAPEVQQHIMALPPAAGRGLLTERRLLPIAKIKDRRRQITRFQDLLCQPVRIPKAHLAPTRLPASRPSAELGA